MTFFEQYSEYIGIVASFIILVALLMTSVKRLRIINLFGAALMFFYGYLIRAYPVMIMNFGIVLINIYYLRQIFSKKDYFTVLEVDKNDEYLVSFIKYYKTLLKQKMAFTLEDLKGSDYRFFILRDMIPAGLFIVEEIDDKTLHISLDFVTPQYRDFKTGEFVFNQMVSEFKAQGYEKFVTYLDEEKHVKYLEKMHFKKATINNRLAFVKNL